jgi:magnesium transporter
MASVDGHLVTTDGGLTEQLTPELIGQALQRREVLWLDLDCSGQDTISVLRDVFRFHPLAIEDVAHFGQRPKVEDYDDFTYIVAFGAPVTDGGHLAEMHCFYSEHYLVTVHQGTLPAVNDGCDAIRRRHTIGPPHPITALYHVLDALTDSMFPYLASFDERIDALQDEIYVRPSDKQLAEMFGMKRELVDMRRLVTPERDMLSSALAGSVDLPGMTEEKERYFRDLYDHLIRISDLVDSYRDLLSGSMDAYLSTVSNRLNVVMKQLTIIATVFLPLSFLTGFFGQNFGWMVQRLGSLYVFLILGLGTEIAAVAGLFWLFRRRGWLR